MANLARNAVCARVQPAADYNAAADARAERHHNGVLTPLSRARNDLAERCAVRIIIEHNRTGKLRLKRFCEADILHPEIGAEHQHHSIPVNRARNANADLRDLVRCRAMHTAQAERKLFHIRLHLCRIAGTGRQAFFTKQRSIFFAQADHRIRAAKVNADSHLQMTPSSKLLMSMPRIFWK